ncbi:glycosyltransferase family 4 protein [Marinilactibacillus sp. Marseille-P9653]|uniref:glycosyltransferase family 4 protein n=1 Tax=Marinilactibacillus sp. Marseille-P9653 TaxID=2866583 RepID=UPI001CE3D36C|nr:glycosyltransferase family 4 protein [Marinilactibacillus sp. Marseille-P9653]
MKYIAEWEKEKSKTWSGTTLSLQNSLKKLTKVQEINLNTPNAATKSQYLIENFLSNQIFSRNMNFNSKFLGDQEKKVLDLLKSSNNNENILQIGDLASIPESSIYQDLSIGSLIHLKKYDPISFNYSGFHKISEKKLTQRYMLQMERYSNARYIFTMSNWLRDFLVDIEGFPSNKVIHVGGGINLEIPEFSEIPENDEKFKILFVGRDFYRKGGDLVVNAYKNLRRVTDLKVELYIAGPKKLEKKFYGEGIFFLGDLDNVALSKYYKECDIFCMPSRFEAYGLVFIEALVYGMPCIARDSFEMRNFIKDGKNGMLIKNDNIQELSLKIYELLTNNQIKQNVQKQKEMYLQEYSWDKVAKKILHYTNT